LKNCHFRLSLKPLGFVLATGLHPLLLKTAAHVFKCLRFAWHRTGLTSLMQELLLKSECLMAIYRPKRNKKPAFLLP
jgi:hypothetical protein